MFQNGYFCAKPTSTTWRICTAHSSFDGLLEGYLRRTNQPALPRYIWLGVGCAPLLSPEGGTLAFQIVGASRAQRKELGAGWRDGGDCGHLRGGRKAGASLTFSSSCAQARFTSSLRMFLPDHPEDIPICYYLAHTPLFVKDTGA